VENIMIKRNLYVLAAQAIALYSTSSTNTFVHSFSLATATRARSGLATFGAMEQKTSATALSMAGGVRTRGLEQRREGASPTEGGMTLYLKAAEDGKSAGDCPFAHYIRMILEEKGLPYKIQPCASNDEKPSWLLEYYEGKMPCLRHRKEAYVESNVIAAYLDYFFPGETKETPESKAALEDAEAALDGFFPAVAGHLKDVDGDDDESSEKLQNLKEKLTALENHFAKGGDGCNLGLSDSFGVLDCRLVPQLYHLQVGIEKFKNGRPSLETEFPKINSYLTRSMERPSFQNTKYSPETIEWGWNNARQ
jgi:RNA polymerase-associated protein